MQTPWGLCWKMESSNFWRNAISFMSPISLAAIEWCKTNLCATYIRQNLSNVSNVDKKPKHVHKHCKDYKGCQLSLSAVLTLALSHDFSFPMCHWLSTMSQKQSIFISLACVVILRDEFHIWLNTYLTLSMFITSTSSSTKKESRFWLNLLITLEKCLSSSSSLLKKGSCECNSICEQ